MSNVEVCAFEFIKPTDNLLRYFAEYLGCDIENIGINDEWYLDLDEVIHSAGVIDEKEIKDNDDYRVLYLLNELETHPEKYDILKTKIPFDIGNESFEEEMEVCKIECVIDVFWDIPTQKHICEVQYIKSLPYYSILE